MFHPHAVRLPSSEQLALLHKLESRADGYELPQLRPMLIATHREPPLITRLHRREADGKYSLVTARMGRDDVYGFERMKGAEHAWITQEQAVAFYKQAQQKHVGRSEAFPVE